MWKTVTLGASCKMYQPKTISAKEMVADGEYVVFGANGIIGKYNKYNHAEPQLLVTCRGATCGAVNVSQPFSWINGNAMVIQPDLNNISLKYMEYLFRGGIDLTKAITGAAQPQITRQSLEPIEFSYPPLAEQQRIVAKLDAAFAEIDEAINLSKQKFKEASDMIGSAIKSDIAALTKRRGQVDLSSICILQNGFAFQSKNFKDTGTPVLRISNIQDGHVTTDRLVFASQDDYKENLSKYTVKQGSLLIAMSGATTGKVGINQTSSDYYLNQRVGMLLPSKQLERDFLYYILTTLVAEHLAISAGAAQPNLSTKQINEIQIPSASLEEQKNFVQKFNSIEREVHLLLTSTTKKVSELQNLKSAILTRELQSEAA